MRAYSIAVVGATGAVGGETVKVLERRGLPLNSLKLLASARSVGKRIPFRGEELIVEELTEASFKGVDIAFFGAGSGVSKQFAPAAAAAGTLIIDKTSAFRMNPDVPLVIPEINGSEIRNHHGIVSSPNCVAAVLTMATYPIHRAHPIRRMVVSSYQSTSGAGAKAMQELISQTRAYLSGEPMVCEAFKHQIAFNLFSHDSRIYENGYNDEENKVIEETRKIMNAPELAVAITCVRVPILRAHSVSVNLEFDSPVSVEEARRLLGAFPGVQVVDDREGNHFPMPAECTEQDDVLVGRIRQDLSRANALELFASGDQLLKGAALNAVQIAEYAAENGIV